MIILLSLSLTIHCSSLLIFSSCLLRHTLPEMSSNVMLSECAEQKDISRHCQSTSQQVIVTNPQQTNHTQLGNAQFFLVLYFPTAINTAQISLA